MRNHRLKDLNATSEDWKKAVDLGNKEAKKLIEENFNE